MCAIRVDDRKSVGTIQSDHGGKPPKGSSADLFFLNLALKSEKDNHKIDPLSTQAADELALVMME